MIKRTFTAFGLALALTAPAFALEIRNTEDCQAAQRAQDATEELGFDRLAEEMATGSYDSYTEWKKQRLSPALDAFAKRFPLTPADAMKLPNYANFVSDFGFRTEQMAYSFHQMQRHEEGSKAFEQYRSTAKIHLDAMKATMAKFREDCII
ncbi:hypothetical protein N2M06_13375 [Oceanimonas sp. AH20CE76]|uniref:hypothetical protein n=1 Tax=Oceanimonas sp. AH20CE76 TaxID=2977120 RepID=UPI0031FE74FF